MAVYAYENLSPQQFQEVCQALLAKAFQDMQCFPVDESDGGRDALVYVTHHGRGRRVLVFQVKFIEPLRMRSEVARLLQSLKREVPKIARLVERGADRYVLLTNATGSGRLDHGAIDKINSTLDALPVPATCWWRADLDRRLDDAWDVKWRYPDLLSGVDFIRAAIEKGVGGHRERRERARSRPLSVISMSRKKK